MQASSAVMRAALVECCEIIRLCEGFGTEGRDAVARVRDLLLEKTKAEHNILPHEEKPKLQSALPKKDRSKLLPRYDLY